MFKSRRVNASILRYFECPLRRSAEIAGLNCAACPAKSVSGLPARCSDSSPLPGSRTRSEDPDAGSDRTPATRGTRHVARGTRHEAERTAPLARSLVVPARAARRHHGAVERSHGCDGHAGVAHRMTQGQRQARRQPATGCTSRYATGRCRDPKDRAPCPRWNGPTDIRMDGPQAAAVAGAALLAGLADLEGLSANCAAAAGMPTHQTDKRGLTSLSDPFAFCLVGPGRLELPTNGLRVRCSTN